MSPLDKAFINRILANEGANARPRAAIPRGALENLQGETVLFCGHTRPIVNAIAYPIGLHNPILVEFLLQRNVTMLDTLLALGTQYLDYQKLEADAVLFSGLVTDLTAIEEKQEAYLDSPEGSSASLLIAQTETSKSSEGIVGGTVSSQSRATSREKSLKGFSKERRNRMVKHEAELNQRRSDLADGSNYGARKRRVVDRYTELMQDAAYRSWAISDGCRICYGKDLSPPQPSEEFLDDLVKWHKLVLDELEKLLRRDNEYPLILPLRLLLADGKVADAHAGTNTYVASGWDATRANIAGDTVRFRISKDAFFPDQDSIRVRGFGVTISGASNVTLGNWRVRVTPPVPSIGDGATPLGLGACYFGSIREPLATEPQLFGSKYYNCDPCAGEWEIRIAANSTTAKAITTIVNVDVFLLVSTLPRIG